jgi:hypothetical protein
LKRVTRLIWLLIVILGLLSASLALGCSSIVQLCELELHGAWDVVRLAEAAAADFGLEMDKDIRISGSSSSIEDLKQGLCNIALLGREPTAEELVGLEDHVIAYDAVCIVIDENSYIGGLWATGGRSIHKTEGLKELTLEDLVNIGNCWFLRADLRWNWQGEYYTWKPLLNVSTGKPEKDPITGIPVEGWEHEPKALFFIFNLLPGKYDTQRSLYDSLGISEQEVVERLEHFSQSATLPDLKYEEEIIAYTYQNETPNVMGQSDFPFKLGFASRRVTLLALKHAPVKVISIDGIDPVAEPQAIYSGTYPLSREIHLITADNSSEFVNAFVDYVLSPSGQELIESAGYLPLLDEEGSR